MEGKSCAYNKTENREADRHHEQHMVQHGDGYCVEIPTRPLFGSMAAFARHQSRDTWPEKGDKVAGLAAHARHVVSPTRDRGDSARGQGRFVPDDFLHRLREVPCDSVRRRPNGPARDHEQPSSVKLTRHVPYVCGAVKLAPKMTLRWKMKRDRDM